MSNSGLKNEAKFLKRVGARRQARSGGILGIPADGKKGRWLIECKSPEGKSVRLESAWLAKIEAAALRHDKLPILALNFVKAPEDAGAAHSGEWLAMPRWLFERLGLWEAKI
jgi:hypothetical protein